MVRSSGEGIANHGIHRIHGWGRSGSWLMCGREGSLQVLRSVKSTFGRVRKFAVVEEGEGEGDVDLQKFALSRYRTKNRGTMGSEMKRYGGENFCKFFWVFGCGSRKGRARGRSLPVAAWLRFLSGFVMAQSSVFGSCAEKGADSGQWEVRAQGMNTLKGGHQAGASRSFHNATVLEHTTAVLCFDGDEWKFVSITRSAKLNSTTRAVLRRWKI
jgi:hypothetical protein